MQLRKFLLFTAKVCVVFYLVLGNPFIFKGNLNAVVTPVYHVKITNDLSQFEEFASMEKEIAYFLKRNRIKGASVGVMYKGQLVYAKGFGWADEEKQVEIEPYHTLRIASVSKWVTALGIMKLVEEGRLRLDDYVFAEGGILDGKPFTSVMKDKRYARIQVHHLLYHTAGWNSNIYGDPMFKVPEFARRVGHEGPITQDDVFAFGLYYRLPHLPGTRYSYSNLGYAFLGRIIEEVSGQKYEDFITEHLLDPLGIRYMALTSTKLEDRKFPEVKQYDHAPGTLRSNAYGEGEEADRLYGGTHYEAIEGAGAWSASPADLLRLLSATDGQAFPPDLLQPETVAKMLEPNEPGDGYIGWVDVKGEQWKRTGTLIGTNALLMRYNEDISYCFITNTSSWKGGRMNNEIQWLMNRLLNEIEFWPAQDLFAYYNVPGLQALAPRKVNTGLDGIR
jgi:CubicO group peptidase (beta-lactamase class C family)